MSRIPRSDELVACQSVLLELSILFRDFWDRCILVGGWVPYFVLGAPEGDRPVTHVGSLDLDVLVDVDAVGVDGYTAAAKVMGKRGYAPGESAFERVREVGPPVLGRIVPVRVHLLAPQSRGTSSPRRRLQGGLQLMALPGADFAMQHRVEHRLEGRLPTGETHVCSLQVADEVACFVMKGSIVPRFDASGQKDKDCYDLFTLLRRYPGGPEAFAQVLSRHKDTKEVQAALENVREQFGEPARVGFQWTVRYLARLREAASPQEVEEIRNEVAYVFDRFLTAVEPGG